MDTVPGGMLVRISELSRRSGVSIPTLKFYLREGLLPAGQPTARNQARYDERHLRRIRLIRTLAGVGGQDLSSIGEIIAAIDDEQVSVAEVYEVLNRRLLPTGQGDPPVIDPARARGEVDALVQQLQWQTVADSPAATQLIRVLDALLEYSGEADLDFFRPLAEVARRLAVAELDLLPAEREAAVARGVLLDAAFTVLRRMALENEVLTRYRKAAATE